MKALVTGANGLIGSHVARALLRSNHQVRLLTRPTSDRSLIEDMQADFVEGDVLAVDDIVRAAEGCDVIFHTAVAFAYQRQSGDDIDRVAVDGTANVLNAAKAQRIQRVIVTSSSVVFGYSTTPDSVDESRLAAEVVGQPAYVQAKVRQDREALRLADQLDLEVVLICPTMAVGPGGARLGPSNAMVVQYLADPFGSTYEGGVNVIAAEDVGEGHVQLAVSGGAGERYILGGDNLSWTEIHTMVAELCGLPPPRLVAAPSMTYLAAWAEEGLSRLQNRVPIATREQASMTGRYYWYSSDKAARAGFLARPARDAIAEAISWLVTTPHVSREMRTAITLHRDVYAARDGMAFELSKPPCRETS